MEGGDKSTITITSVLCEIELWKPKLTALEFYNLEMYSRYSSSALTRVY